MTPHDPEIRALAKAALAGALAMGCFMGFGRFSYTPILPGMMADLRMTAGDAGLVAAANFAGYLIGALLAAGRWAAGRERKVALVAMLATALLLASMALFETVTAFMAIRFLAGVASAFGMVFTSSLVLSAARGNPRVQAAHFGGVGVGIALSALVSFAANGVFGETPSPWRLEWLIGGLIVLVACLPVMRLLPRLKPARAGQATEPPLAWNAAMIRICASYLLFGFGYVVAATFLVAMARAGASGHLVEFTCWLVTGMAGAASLFLWQPVLARLGVNPAYRISLAVEALGSALMVLLPAALAPLVGGLLFGATFIVVTAYALQIGRALSPESPRRVMGLMTAAFGVGQIVGPVAAGYLADLTGSYVVASLVAASMLALGALVAPGRPAY